MQDGVLFYGVASGTRSGHYLFTSSGDHPRSISPRAVADLPAALHRIDSVWTAPRPRTEEEVRNRSNAGDPETQGEARIHYVGGWTIVAWWDRSEDRRGGCNANFLARGRHRFGAMLAFARERFPKEMARMERAYPVALVGGDLPESSVDEEADAFVARFQETLDALHPEVRAAVVPLVAARLRRAVAHG